MSEPWPQETDRHMIENMKRNLIWFQASIKKEIDQNEFENKVVNELYAVVKEVFG